MFLCKIELSVPVPSNQDPKTYIIGNHNFDPGWREGDMVEITDYRVWNKKYNFNAKVIKREYRVYPPNRLLSPEHGIPLEIASKEGIIELSIIVESEDREQILEIAEEMKKN